jgi:hypothetical protein
MSIVAGSSVSHLSEETMATRETTPGRLETSVESVSEAINGAIPVLDEDAFELGRALTTRITPGVEQ